MLFYSFFFFFNDTATTEIYTLSLHDALPIYHIGGPDSGFPIRGNVIDILEVGVGGGSIGWLDEQRRLNVGPRSAGSMPGPACYGRGAAEPTVTDANLMLG